MVSDLLFYSPSEATGEFYSSFAGIEHLSTHTDWRGTWTQIVPGNFGGGNGFTDLLFYDPTTGTGEFYATDGHGGIRLLRQQTGWRTSWTQIIPGNFGGDGRTDLLFYAPSQGTGEFYTTRGAGEIVQLKLHTDWRGTWTRIVPGNFGGDGHTDLLFYDAAAGTGEFYAVSETGGISLLKAHTDWRTTWSQIIPGNFGSSSPRTDLVFYDPTTGTGEFYSTNGRGGISLERQHTDWRGSWSLIVPGQFGGNSQTDLLFYEASTGTGEAYATRGSGDMSRLWTLNGWRGSWKQIVPGLFAPLQAVKLNLKILTDPGVSVERMLAAMREIYAPAGIRVIVKSTERLNLPALLDIDVNDCSSGFGDDIAGDIAELFRHRNFVGDNELAIYFVRSANRPFVGCANHPPGRPGAVVVSFANEFVLAHECGHVLGLHHTDDTDRLMFPNADTLTNLPPDLVGVEAFTMLNSSLSVNL